MNVQKEVSSYNAYLVSTDNSAMNDIAAESLHQIQQDNT